MNLNLVLLKITNIMENLNLSNSCVNCENLLTNSLCGLHKIEVSEKYTCDSFENKQ